MTNETREIQEAMGTLATSDEAESMCEIMDERGLELAGMTDEQFFALIPEALERAA